MIGGESAASSDAPRTIVSSSRFGESLPGFRNAKNSQMLRAQAEANTRASMRNDF